MPEFMTTAEIADYLRLKERKIYELVRLRRIPCSHVTGKLLFPRQMIDLWVARQTEFDGPELRPTPRVAAGSHDLLLEWALRQSGCDLALLAPGNPRGVVTLADLAEKRLRVARRQDGAGAHTLLRHLLSRAGLRLEDLNLLDPPALTETDLAAAIAEGKADCGLAIETVARQFRLDFIPLHQERFDLAMRRRDYFEPPIQALLGFARTPAFQLRAQEFGGYDVSDCGRIGYNA